MVTLRRFGAGLVVGLTLVAVGCATRSINQLLADPAKYRNESVTVGAPSTRAPP